MMTLRTRATLFSSVLINATGSEESEALPLQHILQVEGFSLRAASVAGDADVTLEYALSPDGTNFESYDDNQPITSSTATDKAGNPEGYNTFPMPFSIPASGFIKFRVTGVGSNAADTLVDLYLYFREGIV